MENFGKDVLELINEQGLALLEQRQETTLSLT
jgi:hypothetical protein